MPRSLGVCRCDLRFCSQRLVYIDNDFQRTAEYESDSISEDIVYSILQNCVPVKILSIYNQKTLRRGHVTNERSTCLERPTWTYILSA